MVCTLTIGLTACNKPAEKAPEANANNASAQNVEGQKIKIATEGGYAPFNYKNADGSLGGFDVDVAKAVCAEMKADCEIVAQDWDGIIPGLVAKKYDVIVAGMSVTPERQGQVDFTNPYFKNTLVWLVPKTGKFNLQDIKGVKLGGQRSTTPGAYLQEKYSNGNEVKLYDTYDNAYLDLKAGRVDAVLSEKVTAKEWLKQNNDKFGIVGDEIDNNDNIAMAVRKDDALKESLNKALEAVQKSGKLSALEKQHFGE